MHNGKGRPGNFQDSENRKWCCYCNYRKVFRLYFTTVYKYNYSCTRTGVNFLGLDDQFDYKFLNYISERTVFFLIPIDSNVFFGCDEYYNNADGNLQIATPYEDNIVYL